MSKRTRTRAKPMLSAIDASIPAPLTRMMIEYEHVVTLIRNKLVSKKWQRDREGHHKYAEWVREYKYARDNHPTVRLSRMPAFYRNWRQQAEFVIRRGNTGSRAGEWQLSLCHKGTQQPFMFLTPVHCHVNPQTLSRNVGPVDGLHPPAHLLEVSTLAWDRKLATEDGEDKWCREFVDVFLPDVIDAATTYVMSRQRPTMVCVDDGGSRRITTLEPVDIWQDDAQTCKAKMLAGSPVFIPRDPETKELILRSRRCARMTAPTVQSFSGGAQFNLPAPQQRPSRGDVTADYFTICFNVKKFQTTLQWKSSFLLHRPLGALSIGDVT